MKRNALWTDYNFFSDTTYYELNQFKTPAKEYYHIGIDNEAKREINPFKL